MNPDELLLRDIHLPEPISWWPPAMGWWIIVVALAGTIAVIVWWRRRQIAIRNAPTTIARIELEQLRATWTEHGDTQRLVTDVSTWLRRAGMSLSSRHRAAGLTGEQWRKCLDDIAGEPIFNAANDRLNTEVPYRAGNPDNNPVDGEHLLAQCDHWLDAVLRRVRQT